MGKLKILANRTLIQVLTLIGSNSFFQGFINKTICKSSSKQVCVPFMNCYSCPGARFSCPIGSLQAVLGSRKRYISFYVIGFLMVMGILLGRLICGLLCPFGFIQDMLYKIKSPKYKLPKIFKYVKYIMLLFFVILMPIFITNDIGVGSPYFCKLICPVGTLEGGIFLVSAKGALRSVVGFLFYYKVTVMITILIMSVLIYRPFCKMFCPLAVIYGLFNKISFVQIELDEDKCVACGKCTDACNMDISPMTDPNSVECIRCGNCIDVCPVDALNLKFISKKSIKNNEKEKVEK